jgi:hypothetical protein
MNRYSRHNPWQRQQLQHGTYGRGNSYNTVPMAEATVTIQYLWQRQQLQYSTYGKGNSYNTVPMVKVSG